MDLIILFNTFFGFLTFIAWFSTVGILYLYFSKKTFSKLITDQFLNFAISVAVFSSIGSIVYSEVVGFIPCRFCWYQRYLMYPVAIALLISLFKRPFFRIGYISIIGVVISAYHIFLQNGGGGGGTCAVDVPCDMKYVDIFGFISIPVMAGTGFLTIFVALLYYDFARKELVEQKFYYRRCCHFSIRASNRNRRNTKF